MLKASEQMLKASEQMLKALGELYSIPFEQSFKSESHLRPGECRGPPEPEWHRIASRFRTPSRLHVSGARRNGCRRSRDRCSDVL